MVKCSFLFTESVLRVRNQGQQKPSDASFHLQARPKSLTSILSLSPRNILLPANSVPSTLIEIWQLPEFSRYDIYRVYSHPQRIQSLGCTGLLKTMVSFARYSQISTFYSPQHPNYCNVFKMYCIFPYQLISKSILGKTHQTNFKC